MCTVALKTVSTFDALCETIEKEIFALRFAPGARITESDLSRRYNVSRNTVREAIAYLLSSGLLIKVANKGVYVKEISVADVREIFTLRSLLEAEAVRAIVESGTIPPALICLAREIENIGPETNWATHVQSDIEFHELLVQSAGSPRLMRLYESIIAEVKLCIYQANSFVPMRQENASAHMQLLQAMEQGDLPAAQAILRRHMEQAITSYEAGFRSGGQNA